MVRPSHQDPLYHQQPQPKKHQALQSKALTSNFGFEIGKKMIISSPINIPGISLAHKYASHHSSEIISNSIQTPVITATSSPVNLSSHFSSNKIMRLSKSGHGTTLLQPSASKAFNISPNRRTRGETRKCRKVYGMENRDSWCTQCKWKKACSRFVD